MTVEFAPWNNPTDQSSVMMRKEGGGPLSKFSMVTTQMERSDQSGQFGHLMTFSGAKGPDFGLFCASQWLDLVMKWSLGSPHRGKKKVHKWVSDAYPVNIVQLETVVAYLIFVISFTQAAFSNSKFYTQKLTKNTPKH